MEQNLERLTNFLHLLHPEDVHHRRPLFGWRSGRKLKPGFARWIEVTPPKGWEILAKTWIPTFTRCPAHFLRFRLSGVSGKWDATSLGLERYTGYRSGLGRLR